MNGKVRDFYRPMAVKDDWSLSSFDLLLKKAYSQLTAAQAGEKR